MELWWKQRMKQCNWIHSNGNFPCFPINKVSVSLSLPLSLCLCLFPSSALSQCAVTGLEMYPGILGWHLRLVQSEVTTVVQSLQSFLDYTVPQVLTLPAVTAQISSMRLLCAWQCNYLSAKSLLLTFVLLDAKCYQCFLYVSVSLQ